VRIADGSLIEALGWGTAIVGNLSLNKVWLVPIFGANRLLLVSALALDGYKLVFRNNMAIYTKDNILYF
jgi:hypothetical protein